MGIYLLVKYLSNIYSVSYKIDTIEEALTSHYNNYNINTQ